MKKTFSVLLMIAVFNISWSQTSNSILSLGNWNKITVNKTGVYKITYNDLINMGVDVNSINPKNIRIYGNGAGMLPELNSQYRPDDLIENAIKVIGEDDNVFDFNDYILFYGQSPVVWKVRQDNSGFEHKINLYTDSTFYFLNTEIGLGKRITARQSLIVTPNQFVNYFDDYLYHENETYNFLESGKFWIGEKFDSILTYNFPIYFPNLDTASLVNVYVKVAARSDVTSSFSVFTNSLNILNLNVSPTSLNSVSSNYANLSNGTTNINSQSDSIMLTINYNIGNTTSIGWLDYFELNARRNLVMSSGTQVSFRDRVSQGAGNISKFTVSNTPISSEIWDVTNPLNIIEQITETQGTNKEFIINTDSLKEFIAFDDVSFLEPQFFNHIANQNLHGLTSANLLIVTNPSFYNEAIQLANHHTNFDNISVHTVTTEQIYNEFSSGAQDISAIRDFTKLLYKKGQGTSDSLTQILLFGDASYDYKNRLTNNTNFVPTFESSVSLSPINSLASDDFFTMLDSLEGDGLNGVMDIGVGRLPVKTPSEAQGFVNKIIHYSTNPNTFNNWRTDLCFIADDSDGNEHLQQANYIANIIDTTYNCYNTKKIYLDDYLEINDTAGSSYPSVNIAIEEQLNSGCLSMNYIGHASETRLTEENVLSAINIQSFTNINNLPFFYSGGCESGKFDKPEIISVGESLVLNSQGGSIGVIAPGRLTYSNSNFAFFQKFTDNFFKKNQFEEHYRLGDLIKITKNATSSAGDINKRKFSLIGDPALKLKYPEFQVITAQINGVNVQSQLDTLYQGDTILIEGSIADNYGNIMSGFNGTIYYKFYDKVRNDTTVGNNGNTQFIFNRQDSILIQGNETVINGNFQIQIVVPNNGSEGSGFPKFSFYATNNIIDAMGCFEDIVMDINHTGISENIVTEIQLSVFPTITTEYIYIEINSEKLNEINISINDITGRMVLNRNFKNLENSIFSLDVSNLEKGLYLIHFSGKDSYATHKFIKQ